MVLRFGLLADFSHVALAYAPELLGPQHDGVDGVARDDSLALDDSREDEQSQGAGAVADEEQEEEEPPATARPRKNRKRRLLIDEVMPFSALVIHPFHLFAQCRSCHRHFHHRRRRRGK